MKRNLNFSDYKKCLKESRIVNIINYLEREETDIDCFKEVKKELTKDRLILKTQERFKHERTEEINKIALSSNDEKRIQSIDSIETYAHGMSKDLIWNKEKIKRISIIKQTCVTLIMLKRRHKRT